MIGGRNGSGRTKRYKRMATIVFILALLLTAGCGKAENASSGASEQMANQVASADNALFDSITAESELSSVSAVATNGNGGNGESGEPSPMETGGQANAIAQEAGNNAGAAIPPSGGVSSVGSASDGDGAISRKVIYKANLTMEVGDFAEAQSDIQNLITLHGGYMLQFSESQTEHEKSGNLVMKVPAAAFSAFIDDLGRIEHAKLQKSMQGQDVSEEYVDLESRLRSKQVEESRLLAFMDKAQQADELVAFSSRLGQVQEEIERIKGRMRYLDQHVAFSTVEIRLYQKLKPEVKPNESVMGEAVSAMKASVNAIASASQGLLIVVAGALPVLIVLALLALPVYYYIRKRRPALAKPAAAAAALAEEHDRDNP